MAKMIFKNVRGSYVYIARPRKKDGKETGYGMQLIIPKDDPQIPKLQQAVADAAKEKFGADIKIKNEGKGNMRIPGFKLPLRDGDEERTEEVHEDCYFLNASCSLEKPCGILNRHKDDADEKDLEEYCFSGAYFNVSTNIYGFDNESKGVACWLNNVMLKAKGDRLDNTVTASEDFKDFEAEDGDDDLDDL